jgi:hypothetical protein
MTEENATPATERSFDEKAKAYRSKFRCTAQQVVVEGAKPEDLINVTMPDGRSVKVHNGDYIVKLEDGRYEPWAQDHFERELEDEPGKVFEVKL